MFEVGLVALLGAAHADVRRARVDAVEEVVWRRPGLAPHLPEDDAERGAEPRVQPAVDEGVVAGVGHGQPVEGEVEVGEPWPLR